MTRTLKNINEFILLASLSCGVAFIVRVYPNLFIPVLIVRLGLLAFVYYMLTLEGRREIAVIIGGSIICGWLLGYADWVGLRAQYNPSELVVWVMAVIALLVSFYIAWRAFYAGQTR